MLPLAYSASRTTRELNSDSFCAPEQNIAIERDFLKTLMGGCSTPISALAEIKDGTLQFNGSILSLDGRQKVAVEKQFLIEASAGSQAKDSFNIYSIGIDCANEVLNNGGANIAETIRNAAQ